MQRSTPDGIVDFGASHYCSKCINPKTAAGAGSPGIAGIQSGQGFCLTLFAVRKSIVPA
ncbi:hypothetical protein BGLA2_500027 [Burkholderia gladioli]|nr:hypothetical protein BGLA2_500027 [Burkholderia gladioli]